MEMNVDDRFDLTGKIVIRGHAPEFIGSYSVVHRGKWGANTVAVKIIRPVGALSTMRRKVRRERIVWEALKHPNILPFCGHADDEKFGPFGAFISPWCSKGDVGRFLEQYGRDMRVAERVELWKGVLNGVAFLHGRNPVIVHGDLKPGNVLIDDYRNPRICDFGLARIIQEGGTGGLTTTTEHTGTERYLAPELVTSYFPTPTTSSDVYALGCLGLECIYLERPYKHRKSNHHGCIIIDIREGVTPATREEDIHSPLDFQWGSLHSWDVLEAFWHPDPDGRPAAASAMRMLTTSSVAVDETHATGKIPMQRYDARAERTNLSAYSQKRDTRAAEDSQRSEIFPGSDRLPNSAVSDNPEPLHPVHTSPTSEFDIDRRKSATPTAAQRLSSAWMAVKSEYQQNPRGLRTRVQSAVIPTSGASNMELGNAIVSRISRNGPGGGMGPPSLPGGHRGHGRAVSGGAAGGAPTPSPLDFGGHQKTGSRPRSAAGAPPRHSSYGVGNQKQRRAMVDSGSKRIPSPPPTYGQYRFPVSSDFPKPRSFQKAAKSYPSGRPKGSDFDLGVIA